MPAGDRPLPPHRSARVTFEGRHDDSSWANVMWFFFTGSGTIPQEGLHQMANFMFGTYSDTLLVPQSNFSTLDRVVVLLYSEDGEFVGFSDPASVTGDQGGAAHPASVSCCIS